MPNFEGGQSDPTKHPVAHRWGQGPGRGTLGDNCVADSCRRPLADRGSPGRTHGNAVPNPRIRVCSPSSQRLCLLRCATGYTVFSFAGLAEAALSCRKVLTTNIRVAHTSSQRLCLLRCATGYTVFSFAGLAEAALSCRKVLTTNIRVVLLADLAAVLPGNADRMLALLGEAGVVEDPGLDQRPAGQAGQHPIPHRSEHCRVVPGAWATKWCIA